jgi:hypothetical protein
MQIYFELKNCHLTRRCGLQSVQNLAEPEEYYKSRIPNTATSTSALPPPKLQYHYP